jgi:DNA topoisomerase-3
MQSAGQDIPNKVMRTALRDSGGLGTSATRADILKRLVSRNLLILEQNSYRPSDSAMRIIDGIGDRSFASPVLTGEWEDKLRAVESGSFTGDFPSEMAEYVRSETEHLLSSVGSINTVVGVCPNCGKELVDAGWGIVCRGKKEDGESSSCQFTIRKKIAGYTFTEEDLASLLRGEILGPKKLDTKKGVRNCFFVLKDTGLEFANSPRSQVGICPCCGKPVYTGDNSWYCEGVQEKSCEWSFPRNIKGATLSDAHIKVLLSGKQTEPIRFRWASGNEGTAQLHLDRGVLKWTFPPKVV